jgi:hypothetical protein
MLEPLQRCNYNHNRWFIKYIIMLLWQECAGIGWMVYEEVSVISPPTERSRCVADCKVKHPVLKRAWPLKMARLAFPETSLTNYQTTLHNIPGERRPDGSWIIQGMLLPCRETEDSVSFSQKQRSRTSTMNNISFLKSQEYSGLVVGVHNYRHEFLCQILSRKGPVHSLLNWTILLCDVIPDGRTE